MSPRIKKTVISMEALSSGAGLAILSALLFGASTPLAKLLLRDIDAWMLAVLLMVGLAHTAATTAALLLNLEGVLTALLAWFVFRENVDRRIALGMAAIVAGGIVLTWGRSLTLSAVLGPLMIAG